MRTALIAFVAALAVAGPAAARVPVESPEPAAVMAFAPANISVDRHRARVVDPPATIGGGTTGPPGIVPGPVCDPTC